MELEDIPKDELIKMIEESHKFMTTAVEAIKKRGQTYEFTCPVCGGHAHGGRSSNNGHIHAHCDDCGVGVMQ